MSRKSIFFNSMGGIILEGCLERPASGFTGAGVVLCHPHPLYGGDLHNNVVTAISRGLSNNGILAFSFNFRGVGQSGGSFADGRGEAEDAAAALAFLASEEGVISHKIGLSGYSFGGMIALNACELSDLPSAVAAVSPLIQRGVLRTSSIPKLIIAGGQDHVVPAGDIEAGVQEMADPKEFKIIPEADHFWAGHEKKMADLVVRFFQETLANGSG